MRDKIVAGNWKMNKDKHQALALVEEIQTIIVAEPKITAKVVVAPPFIYLESIAAMLAQASEIHLSAQNCHQDDSGAYTGEISASMLKSIGVQYVILGHSERREYFKESNQLLANKVSKALQHGLTPIFCCGEPLNIRESDQQDGFVHKQLTESLFGFTAEEIGSLVIAYEPIWAIGTGRTASADQAQEMHHSIRKHLAQNYGTEIADTIPILYGGSCKPSNAREIFAGADVDGGLIGGASLKAEDFVAIVRSL